MLGDDDGSTVIPVDAILFTPISGDGPARGSECDEDDQPIAATLHALPKTGNAQVPAKGRFRTTNSPRITPEAEG
jgi:hypothetical protein